jgi:uncharacterized protein (TIGR02001 family)
MKKKITLVVFALLAICTLSLKAQEEEKKSPFTVGADFYSNYVWRGSALGTGPAFQPSVKYNTGGLTVGVWGSFDAQGYAEADPYISYTFNGISLGVTDYYYPRAGGSFASDSTNAVELNLGYTIGGLTLSGNYIVNKASVAASAGKDKYFQAVYAFKNVNFTVGAGDGWHTSDGKFNVCNLGIGTGKVIKITDSFSVPVTGQVIFNPEKNQMFMVVGFSL